MPNWNHIVREHLAVLRLPPEREIEIVEELALHLEAAYEDALADGLPEAEAEARAVQSYDWRLLECELSRTEQPPTARAWQPPLELIERTGGIRMESLLQDLRFGVRMLLKQPGFTLIAVATLALGIGANTAIFSVINTVLLKPLPYTESERLMAVWEVRKDGRRGSVSYPNFVDWRAQNGTFEWIAIYRESTMALTGGSEPAKLRVVIATPDLFPLLNARPQLGRAFLPEEEKAGSRVVVLGEGAWRKHFSADPNLVGRQITLDGKAFTVAGVMPAGFDFPVKAEPTDLWVLAALSSERDSPGDQSQNEQRGFHVYDVIARVKPGVKLEQAQADLETVMGRLRTQYPDEVGGDHTAMQPYLNDLVGDVEWALLVLFGAVGMVLLIACANVASLLLARGVARQRELALRTALGASWQRIVRQLLTESLLLASLGGLAALLLATWGVESLKSLSPENLPRVQDVRLDGRVLIFTLLVTLLTGVIFGLIPALRAARTNLNETLNEGGRSGEGLRRNRLRGALVVAEVALALLLLVGAGLLINSFARLRQVNPGFDPHEVLTLRVDLPDAKYKKPEQITNFNRALLQRIEAVPGVHSAAMVFKLPLSGDASTTFEVEGQPPDKSRRLSAGLRVATPGYFRTLGIPFISGRDFTDRDELKAAPVVIINEALAQQYFPNQNPIGKHLKPGISMDGEPPWREIVGVARAVRHGGLSKEPRPEFYLPHPQMPGISLTTVVRTDGDPLAIVSAVRNEVRALDSELPVDRVKTLDQYLAESVAQPRFNTLLLALFAGVALILTAIGLYGVMAYSVMQRTREIGVRVALGAQTGDVLRLVIGQGMKLALSGVAIGLAASFALTRFMKTLLFGVGVTDPLTFAVVALVLTLVALLACWIPARRATKVDPLTALRHE
jgi:putative ABC transport system permease protein